MPERGRGVGRLPGAGLVQVAADGAEVGGLPVGEAHPGDFSAGVGQGGEHRAEPEGFVVGVGEHRQRGGHCGETSRGVGGRWSSSGAGRADGPVLGGPAGRGPIRPVVTGGGVLAVADRRWGPAGDVGYRGEEPVDVGRRGVDPSAGPYRPWAVAAVAVAARPGGRR